jgi:hypothetical protein
LPRGTEAPKRKVSFGKLTKEKISLLIFGLSALLSNLADFGGFFYFP